MSEHGTYCCETCRAEGWRCPAPCARPCCAATQPEPVTADVEALLLRVAEEHRLIPAYRGAESGRCRACHAPELRDMLGPAAHRAHVASAQAAALAGMGTVREEWGVRVTTEDRVWEPRRCEWGKQDLAEAEADRLFSHLAPLGLYNGQRFVRADVLRRTRTTYADTVTEWEQA